MQIFTHNVIQNFIIFIKLLYFKKLLIFLFYYIHVKSNLEKNRISVLPKELFDLKNLYIL